MSVSAPSFFEKLRGEKVRSGIAYPRLADVAIAGLGGLLVISALYLLHHHWKVIDCFIVPFGASAVLVFSAPSAPFSQPRNVIGGHLISALVGITAFLLFREASWWTLALANAVAISLMVATKTVHPPAGATAFLPMLTGITEYQWALFPVLTGSIIIVLIGLLYNNLFSKRRYPVYWI